jgi:anti-anti-sigma regulatory factor
MGSPKNGVPPSSRTVALPARVDMDNICEIEPLLREAVADGGVLDLDCTELRFVDSAGAKMLFQLANYADESRCLVYVSHLRDGPLRVLTLLGIFDVFRNRDA